MLFFCHAFSTYKNDFLSMHGDNSQFDPVECTDERGSGKKIASKLVVAGGDAPPIFDAAQEVFDFVSSPIETLGAIGFLDGR